MTSKTPNDKALLSITIASIGALALLGTAVLNNWDKIFPPKDYILYCRQRILGSFS